MLSGRLVGKLSDATDQLFKEVSVVSAEGRAKPIRTDFVRTLTIQLSMAYEFSLQKDELLRRHRGISFIDVIEVLAADGALVDFEHPNQERYPGQRVYVIVLGG